jgi:MOSC domain-containing protein
MLPSDSPICGRVVALWRYPVKSMQGEELNAIAVTERGLLGDRAYALIDEATGKVVSAKNPRKWPTLLDFRAGFEEPPCPGSPIPPVRITLPDGMHVSSRCSEIHRSLSSAVGREVTLRTPDSDMPTLEIYWPDIQGVPRKQTITEQVMPAGTFLDEAHVHVLTTATLDHLHEINPQTRFETHRFRPNIVIALPPEEKGFVENRWVNRTLVIGEVRLRVFRPCPRCVMTTLPQGDLPSDHRVLRTVAESNQGNAGVRANVLQPGYLRRGDSVRLE